MATRKKQTKTSAKSSSKRVGKAVRARPAKPAPKKAARRAPEPNFAEGTIAHTEFASADPAATRTWAQKTLGWTFMPPMPMPGGDYHMFETEDNSGGLRDVSPPETPGTIAYVAVENMQRAYEKALKNGGTSMMPPTPIGGGMGSMAVVIAPGGVAIGLWSSK